MNKTKIGWVKNPDGTQGFTFNPVTGCLNRVGRMCKGGNFPCFAYRLAKGRLKTLYLANRNTAPSLPYCIDGTDKWDSFYPRFWPKRLGEPQSLGGGKGIFVCDMSDLFGIGIPENWTKQVMAVIEGCPQHRFYLLTKQPQNLLQWSPFPDNCWVGVSATDYHSSRDAMALLEKVKAKVKYLSFEPLLGAPIIASDHLKDVGIGWVIIGLQTPYSPKTAPQMVWIDDIVRPCDKAGIPVFLKNNLMPLVELVFGRENYLSPILTPDGDLRQEMPTV